MHPFALSFASTVTKLSVFINSDYNSIASDRNPPPLPSHLMARRDQKKRVPPKPTLLRVAEVGDSAHDHEVFPKKAGIKPAAYEEVLRPGFVTPHPMRLSSKGIRRGPRDSLLDDF